MLEPFDPDSVFEETDFERAFDALDLCLQNYAWSAGENQLTLPSVLHAMQAMHITYGLSRALLRRLIAQEVFKSGSTTIPAGYSYQDGCPLPILRLESETTHFLITTQEQWCRFLMEHRRLRKEAKQETEAVAPLENSFTKRKSPDPDHAADLKLEKRAIGALVMHSDWSIEQIADDLGVHRSTLYRLKQFRATAEQVGKLKPRGAKDHSVRRGHKTQDGRIEAYADSVDDD